MTTNFFAPPEAVHGRRLVLPPDEARHATRTLRHTSGDEIWVVDGAGCRHHVRLEQAGQNKTVGTILETQHDVGEPPYQLTLGLGLLKKRDRFEFFLEKAVELGATQLLPLRTHYTERETLREDRAQRLLRAALKQSGRCRLPVLAPPTSLRDQVSRSTNVAETLIAHRRTGHDDPSLSSALAATAPTAQLHVLIGPEGGFSEREITEAEAAGATVVTLGPRRLRAETAALTAASTVMMTLDA